jgi:stage II sporulation protein D
MKQPTTDITRSALITGAGRDRLRFRAPRTFFLLPLLAVLPAMISFLTSARAAIPGPSAGAGAGADVGQILAPSSFEEIHVRLQKLSFAKDGRRSITVTGLGLRFTGSPAPSSVGFRALRIVWEPASGGLQSWVIADRDSGKEIARIRAKTLDLAGKSLRVNLKAVPDRLTIYPVKGGADLIGRMDIETYVKGVLPGEMPAGWPLEALKAQAVAARTFALYRKKQRERIGSHFHLESDVMDQVFLAPLESGPAGKYSRNVTQAVDETAGVILRDRQKRVMAAYFHADCGGRTEDARKIWGGGDTHGTATDAQCPSNSFSHWKIGFTHEEIAARIRPMLGVEPSIRLVSLALRSRTGSGRVETMDLHWSDGAQTQVTGHQFRMAMGHERVKSANFEVSRVSGGRTGRDKHLEFTGKGAGHGAGMCQWGARNLAVSGRKYAEILRHYYPGARFQATGLGESEGAGAGVAQSDLMPEKL